MAGPDPDRWRNARRVRTAGAEATAANATAGRGRTGAPVIPLDPHAHRPLAIERAAAEATKHASRQYRVRVLVRHRGIVLGGRFARSQRSLAVQANMGARGLLRSSISRGQLKLAAAIHHPQINMRVRTGVITTKEIAIVGAVGAEVYRMKNDVR